MPCISVPQAEGSISISTSGEEPLVWHVQSHEVDVAPSDLSLFLRSVSGAVEVGDDAKSAKPAESNKETDQRGSSTQHRPPKHLRRKDQQANG